MISQNAFAVGGMVSIWVGNFASEEQFDAYMNLSKQFEKDFGFIINDRAVREGSVESAPTSIETLVRGFSSWESFAAAVVQAAKTAGVDQATTMIVFYSVQFEPAQVRMNPNAPLKFVGSFPFS